MDLLIMAKYRNIVGGLVLGMGLALVDIQVLPPLCLAQGISEAQRMVDKGADLYSDGKYDDAIGLFKKAIVLEPQNEMAYYNLGQAYRKRKDYTLARSSYQKAVELKPQDGNAWGELGHMCENLKELAAAEAAYKQSVSLDPSCKHLCNLGYMYMDSGRLKEARELLLKASCLPEAKSPEYIKEIPENLDYLAKRLSSQKSAGE